jgi:hypothetical protein
MKQNYIHPAKYSVEILISNLTDIRIVPVTKDAGLWPDTLNAPDAKNASESQLTVLDTFRLLSSLRIICPERSCTLLDLCKQLFI